jgi:thiamine-monophosphate kinase
MSREFAFIDSLRSVATSPAARDLIDDVAVLEVAGRWLALSHDMIVEGVHFLPDDAPADIAWKLVAVNLSDLAAKGARPLGVLLGYMLGEAAWDAAFVAGLKNALDNFGLALLGGDTVSAPAGNARAFGLTAIGEAAGPVPSRAGAKPGHSLWVTGTIGDAGAGLRIARGELEGAEMLPRRYRRPEPRLDAGLALAPLASAMMDVSDGLLIDAARLASASEAAIEIDLSCVPLSRALIGACGEDRGATLAAATAGDDYELLFTLPPDREATVRTLSAAGCPPTRIGTVREGDGLTLSEGGKAVPLPASLGYQHD